MHRIMKAMGKTQPSLTHAHTLFPNSSKKMIHTVVIAVVLAQTSCSTPEPMVSPPQAGEGFLCDAWLPWENFTEEEGWGITMHWVKGYEVPAVAKKKNVAR